jgi:hypothetical protein
MMPDMTVSRKQRLRTLENQIRKNYEAFVATGFALKEIRDDELYQEDSFETWDAYLKERVATEFGIEERQVRYLISSAQIRTKLPDLSGTAVPEAEWSVKAVNEFGRLAPQDEDHEQRRDYDRLDKRDVNRVAKKVIDHCEQEGTKPTATIVRKFVDEDLGVNRAAQAKETKRRREAESKVDLHRFLDDMTGRLEAEVELLSPLADNESAWKLLRKEHPGVMKRFIEACDSLADLIRRIGR